MMSITFRITLQGHVEPIIVKAAYELAAIEKIAALGKHFADAGLTRVERQVIDASGNSHFITTFDVSEVKMSKEESVDYKNANALTAAIRLKRKVCSLLKDVKATLDPSNHSTFVDFTFNSSNHGTFLFKERHVVVEVREEGDGDKRIRKWGISTIHENVLPFEGHDEYSDDPNVGPIALKVVDRLRFVYTYAVDLHQDTPKRRFAFLKNYHKDNESDLSVKTFDSPELVKEELKSLYGENSPVRLSTAAVYIVGLIK